MGYKCHVPDCTSDSTSPADEGVTFHKMPYFPQRDEWMDLCRIPEKIRCQKQILVCSRHFRNYNFKYSRNQFILKPGVMPTVFPWTENPPRFRKLEELEGYNYAEESIKLPLIQNGKRVFITISKGSRLNVLDRKWYPATVLIVNSTQKKVLVQFDEYLKRANKWIEVKRTRIRCLHETEYKQNIAMESGILKTEIKTEHVSTEQNKENLST